MKLSGGTILIIGFSALCLVFSSACSSQTEVANQIKSNEASQTPSPKDEQKPPIYPHIAAMSSAELCDRLVSVDTLPGKDPNITDPIYESLVAKGEDALPCLADKISDLTPVPDPRNSAPRWEHFKVGDTAVFTLLDIVSRRDDAEWEKLMLASLPTSFAKEWEANGMYAYFNYVSETKNRIELQNWWKKWLRENKK